MSRSTNFWLTLLTLTNSLIATSWMAISAVAQVTPAFDGTGTIVSPRGTQIDIGGGSRSADGHNLFHSFGRFDLNAQQTATFLSTPQVQNILGRISGEASRINGLIQVSGSTANLFLINPAGILFGPNARLNLSGAFTATTATGIGFGDRWWNAFGENNYSALVGNPESLAFMLGAPSAIANLGNLAVNPGQNLTLAGGTVLSTGTLSAPGGNITIASVAGGSRVRISQEGALIQLDLAAAPSNQPDALFSPTSLPALLTGGDLGEANTVTVAADGTVHLMRSPIPVGTSVGSTTVSGKVDVAGDMGGSINVLGRTISLQDASLDASGTIGGGNIRIGGDFRGLGPLPTADQTWVDRHSTLKANALTQGNGGQVVLWADQTTRFDGSIQAQGGISGGDGGIVEVSGKDTLIFRGAVDTIAPQGKTGTLLLDPQNIVVVDGTGAANDPQLNDGQIFATDGGNSTFTISEQMLESLAGGTNVVLEATNNITINNLSDNALTFQTGSGSIAFNAGGTFSMNGGDTIRAEQRSVSITAASIIAGAIDTSTNVNGLNAGAINLTATSGAITTGALNAGTQIASASGAGDGGNVTLNAATGILVSGGINTASNLPGNTARNAGNGGNVSLLTASGNITVLGDVQTFSLVGNELPGNGGSITLTAPNGSVTADNLDSRSVTDRKAAGNAGAITVTAGTSLFLENISASSSTGDTGNTGSGGAVSLNAKDNVLVDGINAVSQDAGGVSTALSQSISITGDGIELYGGPNSVAGRSITLQPSRLAQTIEIGGNTSGSLNTLNLTIRDLATLQDGFSSITIGRSDGSGEITLAKNFDFSDPLILRSPNGSINTNGFNLSGTDNAAFTLLAGQSITAANITTQGGAIALTSNGNITTGGLSTEHPSGIGGDISITAGNFFRATNTFTAADNSIASLSSIGGNDSGFITIRHGGNGSTPFDVGSGAVNGTAGAITSSRDVIAPFQSFLGEKTLGNLAILTQETPLERPASPLERPTPPLETPTPPLETPAPPLETPAPPLETPAPPLETPEVANVFPEVQGNLALSNSTPQANSARPTAIVPPANRTQPGNSPTVETPKILPEEPEILDPEQSITRDFQDYLTLPKQEQEAAPATIEQTQSTLRQVESTKGLKSALLYVHFKPAQLAGSVSSIKVSNEIDRADQNHDMLELVLVTASGKPIRRQLRHINRANVLPVVEQLQQQITDATTTPYEYLPPAQQLYNWIIAPVIDDLEQRGIQNITFILDKGLRSIPVAALHSGNHFLVQDYSVGLMPSFSLTKLSDKSFDNMSVLAMGASEFKEHNQLPAVPIELSAITQKLRTGKSLLNNDFTIQNLQSQRSAYPFNIVHLATHGKFRSGKASNSYIQFWDQKLSLDQLRQLGLENPPVDLLVLSACTTALGDEQAELGFAGMAIQAGVNSSLASLWSVSDEATLGLMTGFYHQLQYPRMKVEALRQTQLAMINRKIRIEDGRLINSDDESVDLPPVLANSGTWDFVHPIYWSAFTLIGSPW